VRVILSIVASDSPHTPTLVTDDKILLIVDDETSILKSLERELAPWVRAKDMRIMTATSAAEAERIVERKGDRVCLLLSDVRMPGGNGPDLIERVHRDHPDIIALLLTAFAELPELIKAVRAGAFAYILKPWDPAYLQSELEKALRVYELQELERKHLRHIEEDLRWAGELQHALFCGALPLTPRVSFNAVYLPLPEFKCSGDYLDVIAHDENRSTMLVGDVAGHGVRAALVASFLKALVGAAFLNSALDNDTVRLSAVLAGLNATLCQSLPASLGMMITLGALTIDTLRGEVVVASAGHPPALLIRDGRAHALPVEGVALGGNATSVYAERRIRIQNGDKLVLYTDGLVESADGSLAEKTNLLARAAESHAGGGDLADFLVSTLRPGAGFNDDVAVVTAAVLMPPSAGVVPEAEAAAPSL
jgi:phosphoserine phosphatase RsbU/P